MDSKILFIAIAVLFVIVPSVGVLIHVAKRQSVGWRGTVLGSFAVFLVGAALVMAQLVPPRSALGLLPQVLFLGAALLIGIIALVRDLHERKTRVSQ